MFIDLGPNWYKEPRMCATCNGTGRCHACRGTGRSGAFLNAPPSSAPLCNWCEGSLRCHRCRGGGQIVPPAFVPKIHILTAMDTPTSIEVDAFNGMFWKRIHIPPVVSARNWEAQRGWVSWRVRRHFRDVKGERGSDGQITGYLWSPVEDASIPFDIHGQVDSTNYRAFLSHSRRDR